MHRGAWLIGMMAAAFVVPATAAFGQASFGPIQPFAGAPSPVYVAAPYAAPTVLAPIPAAPVFSATPPEIQIPSPTAAPSLMTPPGATILPAQPYGVTPSYHPAVGAPTTSYYAPPAALAPGAAVLGTGLYGQPTAYITGQPLRNYVRYLSP